MLDREQLKLDLQIEPSQLDVECVRQGDAFFDYAEQEISAKAEVERLEFELEKLMGNLQLQVRENPEDFGLKTTTEATIKAVVAVNPKVEKLTSELRNARKIALLATKATVAMEMRKKMLELLVQLHGQQYFAGPSTPRNLVQAWKDHQKKTSEEANQRQAGKARRVSR